MKIIMKKTLILLFAVSTVLAGCAELTKVLGTLTAPLGLTEAEVVGGLKEALVTGAKNSANRLSIENGYYGDELVKILLPEEAQIIVKNISRVPGGGELVEKVILSINRAAEDAAKEVAPIFASSIAEMTLSDAFGILNGAENAATVYLKGSTYNKLYSLYLPKIEASIEKDLIGNLSAADTWNSLISQWNTLANSIAGRIANLTPVNTELDDYLTKKALDGIFIKVENEEKLIRTQVSARVSPLMQKVFGSLD